MFVCLFDVCLMSGLMSVASSFSDRYMPELSSLASNPKHLQSLFSLWLSLLLFFRCFAILPSFLSFVCIVFVQLSYFVSISLLVTQASTSERNVQTCSRHTLQFGSFFFLFSTSKTLFRFRNVSSKQETVFYVTDLFHPCWRPSVTFSGSTTPPWEKKNK